MAEIDSTITKNAEEWLKLCQKYPSIQYFQMEEEFRGWKQAHPELEIPEEAWSWKKASVKLSEILEHQKAEKEQQEKEYEERKMARTRRFKLEKEKREKEEKEKAEKEQLEQENAEKDAEAPTEDNSSRDAEIGVDSAEDTDSTQEPEQNNSYTSEEHELGPEGSAAAAHLESDEARTEREQLEKLRSRQKYIDKQEATKLLFENRIISNPLFAEIKTQLKEDYDREYAQIVKELEERAWDKARQGGRYETTLAGEYTRGKDRHAGLNIEPQLEADARKQFAEKFGVSYDNGYTNALEGGGSSKRIKHEPSGAHVPPDKVLASIREQHPDLFDSIARSTSEEIDAQIEEQEKLKEEIREQQLRYDASLATSSQPSAAYNEQAAPLPTPFLPIGDEHDHVISLTSDGDKIDMHPSATQPHDRVRMTTPLTTFPKQPTRNYSQASGEQQPSFSQPPQSPPRPPRRRERKQPGPLDDVKKLKQIIDKVRVFTQPQFFAPVGVFAFIIFYMMFLSPADNVSGLSSGGGNEPTPPPTNGKPAVPAIPGFKIALVSDKESVTNGEAITYSVTITYDKSVATTPLENIEVFSTLPATVLLSETSGTTSSADGTSIVWPLSDPNNQLGFTFTLQPKDPEANDSYLSITVAGRIKTGGPTTGGGASTPPSTNDCGGKYALSMSKNPKQENFGDPSCDYSEDKLYEQLKQEDPARVEVWYFLAHCEASIDGVYRNPNAYLAASESGFGAYGLFQMNPNGKSTSGPNDIGDVSWSTQTSNAIALNAYITNVLNLETFSYWQRRADCQWWTLL